MAIRATAVYSGWICQPAAGSAVQTRAGSKNGVMVGKKKSVSVLQYQTIHNTTTRQEADCSVNIQSTPPLAHHLHRTRTAKQPWIQRALLWTPIVHKHT